MKTHHKYLAVLTAIAVSAAITMATLRNQDDQINRNSPGNQQISKPDSHEWPVAAYENREQADEKQRAKREAKSTRYNRSFFGVKGAIKSAHEDSSIILTEDWEESIAPLPVSQSNLIAIGTVIDAKAFVSTDQTGVYSEFPTRIDEVLKADDAAQINPGGVIMLQRSGGKVQGPSARLLFRIRGQNMPQQGKQYVLFLGQMDEGEDYKLITGYELRGGKVFPLDSVDRFTVYTAWDKATFLQVLRDEIAQP